jgi:hypothetical protein
MQIEISVKLGNTRLLVSRLIQKGLFSFLFFLSSFSVLPPMVAPCCPLGKIPRQKAPAIDGCWTMKQKTFQLTAGFLSLFLSSFLFESVPAL